MRQVVIAHSAVESQAGCGGAALRASGVYALRKSVREQSREPMGVALLELGLKRIVVGILVEGGVCDVSPLLIRTTRLNSAWSGRGIVDRHILVQVCRLSAYISDVQRCG